MNIILSNGLYTSHTCATAPGHVFLFIPIYIVCDCSVTRIPIYIVCDCSVIRIPIYIVRDCSVTRITIYIV